MTEKEKEKGKERERKTKQMQVGGIKPPLYRDMQSGLFG
jgi:hypothetical protein